MSCKKENKKICYSIPDFTCLCFSKSDFLVNYPYILKNQVIFANRCKYWDLRSFSNSADCAHLC